MQLVDSKPEPDLSGKQLGDYLLMRRLGRGGMADVYLAEQKSLRRQVAFKVLHANLADDDSYVKRFHNEAQAVAALVHTNIVQIHEVGCIAGVHFIAQEYVAGQNLQQALSRRGALEIDLAVDVMRQVAAALHRANERGIVHRDIKPENILLASDGEVKVADFGLARIAESENVGLTQVGMTLGTPLYMSPEQAEGKATDHRTDLYSLGVTSYQMLAGRTPFEGDTALSIAVQHLKTEPKPLSDRRPDLPNELCRIIHQLLAKAPAKRYQSAAELLQDLRELPAGSRSTEWPSEVNGLSTRELVANVDALTAATEQLQTVMLTEVQQPKLQWRVALIVGVVVGALLLGGFVAWLTRPEHLLVRSGSPAIKRFDTAARQFGHAMTFDGPLVEAAFQSVITHFADDPDPASQSSVIKARLQLAYHYHDTERVDEAIKLFKGVADQETDLRLQVMALIRLANIYARQRQFHEASQLAFRLAQITEQTPGLSPAQRRTRREEIASSLNLQVSEDFRQHVDSIQSSSNRRNSPP